MPAAPPGTLLHGVRNVAPAKAAVTAGQSWVREWVARAHLGRGMAVPSPLPGQSAVVPVGPHTLPLPCSLLFFNTKSRNYFLNDCNFIF